MRVAALYDVHDPKHPVFIRYVDYSVSLINQAARQLFNLRWGGNLGLDRRFLCCTGSDPFQPGKHRGKPRRDFHNVPPKCLRTVKVIFAVTFECELDGFAAPPKHILAEF